VPYRWKIEPAKLDRIANREKKVPRSFFSKDGYGITPAARAYLSPLIRGESPPPYGRSGLPEYVTLKNAPVRRKLPTFEV
jgi:6-phosphofructokinase 1